jgi:hypothetical protein
MPGPLMVGSCREDRRFGASASAACAPKADRQPSAKSNRTAERPIRTSSRFSTRLRSRRLGDGPHRPVWVESTPTRVSSRRTGIRGKVVVPRNSLDRPKRRFPLCRQLFEVHHRRPTAGDVRAEHQIIVFSIIADQADSLGAPRRHALQRRFGPWCSRQG